MRAILHPEKGAPIECEAVEAKDLPSRPKVSQGPHDSGAIAQPYVVRIGGKFDRVKRRIYDHPRYGVYVLINGQFETLELIKT